MLNQRFPRNLLLLQRFFSSVWFFSILLFQIHLTARGRMQSWSHPHCPCRSPLASPADVFVPHIRVEPPASWLSPPTAAAPPPPSPPPLACRPTEVSTRGCRGVGWDSTGVATREPLPLGTRGCLTPPAPHHPLQTAGFFGEAEGGRRSPSHWHSKSAQGLTQGGCPGPEGVRNPYHVISHPSATHRQRQALGGVGVFVEAP